MARPRATPLQVFEQAAPSTPPSGRGYVYEKSDKRLYFKDSAGVERELTTPADVEFLAWWGAF